MESLREFFRTGMGPSSSHTMGPRRAAELFAKRNSQTTSFRVTLYGSLAATGKGHLTDQAILQALAPKSVKFIWEPKVFLETHPNGLLFEALDSEQQVLDSWTVFSVGGGVLREAGQPNETRNVYSINNMAECLTLSESRGEPFWALVEETEGKDIWDFLANVWETMTHAIQRGLAAEGALPGGLNLQRKARGILAKAKRMNSRASRTGFISAYALAASEENAAGGVIVTAPTCGSCGILPACLYYFQKHEDASLQDILRALATAGLVGDIVKQNGSIAGAEVGCQGEVGVACAIAAAASAQILGGTPRQMEYAAEMGLEHFLGLTCDPVRGLVQIPCIERNAMGALRAMDCAEYALFSDGQHRVSFDQVVRTMLQTGRDLPSLYRETATGGLADVVE